MADRFPAIPSQFPATTFASKSPLGLPNIPQKWRGAATIAVVILAVWIGIKIFSCIERFSDGDRMPLTVVDPSTVTPWSGREGVHEVYGDPTAAPGNVELDTTYTSPPLDSATGNGVTASPDDGAWMGAGLDIAFNDMSVPAGSMSMPPTSVSVDLLPKPEVQTDDASTYAPKALAGMSFLDATQYIGVDTVGSALKNANYDIRNTIPNPTTPTGPWNQSSVMVADFMRRPLE